MEKLISLNCSSESIEKSIVLFYNTLKTNEKFYKNYETIIFFGNDLPKKNLSMKTVGSVKFYMDVCEHVSSISTINEKILLKNKKIILNKLLINNYVSNRSYQKLIDNDDRYLNFIYKIPYSYINNDFINELISYFEKRYNVKFVNLFLKYDYIKIMNEIYDKKNIYCIYGLNYNGSVGKYSFLYKNNNEYFHLINSLKNNAVLSCNTALLIKIIQNKIKNQKNTIVGYREQKRFGRIGQIIALKEILEQNKNIEEPKNSSFNKYYDLFKKCLPYELNYEVIKKAYIDMLKDI